MLKFSLTLLVTALVTLGAPKAQAQDFLRADEDRVHAMVNATRVAKGLAPLTRHEGLVDVARRQSVRMVEQNKLYHNPDLRLDLDVLGLDWHWSGENVGVGPTVEAIEEAFLGSLHHYENIVRSNYTAMGIGVVPTKSGYVYVTQVFAELGSAAAPRPAPAPPAPTAAPPTAPPPSTPAPLPPTPTPVPVAVPDPVVIQGGVVNDARFPALD